MFLQLLRSETAESPERLAAALRGLRRYQEAPRADPRAPRAVAAQAGRAVLRDCGGIGPPVVVIPSIINPPDVLDLAGDRSFVGWLATQGARPLLLDWGTPGPGERALSLAGHVETMLLPLLGQLPDPPVLVGYCLGGTMAVAAAALRPVRGLALLATPWRFGRYPAETQATLAEFWRHAAPAADALGLLPMEVLQAAFWQLDPARTVAKYARLGTDAPDPPALAAFVQLEDWANDGPPLTLGAARELFIDLFGRDLPGDGGWQVAGRAIDPATITAPILEISSTIDRIVPAAAALGRGEAHALDLGHVGMIVGSQARARLWRPVAAWLSRLA